jgi:hypothetical protein
VGITHAQVVAKCAKIMQCVKRCGGWVGAGELERCELVEGVGWGKIQRQMN